MGTTKGKPRPNEAARNGTDDGLTPKQEACAVELARGASYTEVTKATGVGLTTVKVWAATVPAFKHRVTELRAELSARVLGRIAKGMMTAVDTLEHLCTKGKTEATQLRAAEAMLTHGTALGEVADLKARLAALETGGAR